MQQTNNKTLLPHKLIVENYISLLRPNSTFPGKNYRIKFSDKAYMFLKFIKQLKKNKVLPLNLKCKRAHNNNV